MVQTYAKQLQLNRPDVDALVQRLTLVDLVTFYTELPLTCVLSDVIKSRLDRQQYTSWLKITHFKYTKLQFLNNFLNMLTGQFFQESSL